MILYMCGACGADYTLPRDFEALKKCAKNCGEPHLMMEESE